MSQPVTSKFYFELSLLGEKTDFQEVENVSTSVALRDLIRPGENPFKYRIPSLPKGRKLILKKGFCKPDSKLLSWMNSGAENKPGRERAVLALKDDNGNVLIEWTIFGSLPAGGKAEKDYSKAGLTGIETLALDYGFYTLNLK